MQRFSQQIVILYEKLSIFTSLVFVEQFQIGTIIITLRNFPIILIALRFHESLTKQCTMKLKSTYVPTGSDSGLSNERANEGHKF